MSSEDCLLPPPCPKAVSWVRLALPLAALAGLLFAVFSFDDVQRRFFPAGKLVATATISAGQSFHLFTNRKLDEVSTETVFPGDRAIYVFENLPPVVTFLRLDPGEVEGATIEIENVAFYVDGDLVASAEAGDIRSWAANNLELLSSPPSVARFRAATADPYLVGSGFRWGQRKLPLPREVSGLVERWGDLALLVIALLTILYRRSVSYVMPVVVCVLTLSRFGPPVAAWIVAHAERLGFRAPPVDAVVGQASYFGTSKSAELAVFFASIAASLAIGIVLSRLAMIRTNVVADLEADSSHARRHFSRWFVALVFLAFFAVDFPRLRTVWKELQTSKFEISDFDGNNIRTWDYLEKFGYLPHRDYWFPYGGMYDQIGVTPQDELNRFLHQLAIFAVFFPALYRLLGYRRGATLLVMIALAIPIDAGYFRGTDRYFLSVTALLGMLALLYCGRTPKIWHFLYGVFLGYVFIFESAQLIYAAPALGIAFGYYYLQARHRQQSRQAVFCALCWLLPLAAVAGAYLLRLGRHGQLAGFTEFYRRLPALSAGSAIPAPIADWFAVRTIDNNLVLLGLNALACLAAYLASCNRREFLRPVSAVLFAGSALLGMIVLKHITRPHMGLQVLGPMAAVILMVACWWFTWLSARTRIALVAATGLIFGLSSIHGPTDDVVSARFIESKGLFYSLRRISQYGKSSAEAIDPVFSETGYTGWTPQESALIKHLREQQLTDQGSGIFVLGNQSFFYVLLRQKPPRYLSLFDGSSIWAQREIAQWLAREQPPFVIFDQQNLSTDWVPNVVRLPILYTAVAGAYRPDPATAGLFGRYRLLVPLEPGAAPDFAFWQETLGRTVSLGKLPELTSIDRLQPCGAGDSCTDFAMVSRVDRELGNRLVASISGLAQPFNIEFSSDPAKRDLYIPLDRLWFWKLAAQHGRSTSLRSAAGAKAVPITRRRGDENILY